MPTIKLTNPQIKGFAYEGDGKSRDVRWDTEVPGLGVRVYPSGKKSFVLSYRVRGRKRLLVLAAYGKMTLAEARTRARKRLVDVADGVDPLEEKRKAAQGRTVRHLVTKYIEDHAKKRKKSWRLDERWLNLYIPANWYGRKVDSITVDEVAALHARIGEVKPYAANRFLEIVRRMFNLAKRPWRMLDETASNPAVGIDRFPETKRKRWLTPHELPKLIEAIDQEPNIYIRAVVWLLLLTGLRKMELMSAKWDDVQWEQGQLRLPRTKSGEEQLATLSAPAMAILQSIPRLEDNPYIIPGMKAGQHLKRINPAWSRITKTAGVQDLQIHDLRRTTGSWMTQAGVDLNTIREALRHSSLSTTLVYARLGQDAAREAMEAHGKRILEAAGRRGPLTVIEGGAKET